ncbi:MAG: LUD domain-containing protein [Gemmatales bacterium]|nr:LUD domain-containing protein [Gemmatales bacterium]MDW7994081.1 LUD domain-containing protein [Gemmatales bacterium]
MSAHAANDRRTHMLARIREAVRQGNHYGVAPEPGPRGSLGYQGTGADDRVEAFARSLRRAGGHFHRIRAISDAPRVIIPILENAHARRVGISAEPIFEEPLFLAKRLRAFGLELWQVTDGRGTHATAAKDALFALEAGITGVEALIAETGTIVLAAKPERPRSLSLLPPLFIALARTEQIVPDLFDWFALAASTQLPSAWTFITGPSKTGDIELTLVTGVHGPGEVHVIVCET